MKRILSFTLILLISYSSMGGNLKHNVKPNEGYVPNAETAIKIAEAIWLPIYGADVINKKPFKAKLEGKIWIVEGSLPKSSVGGVPVAEISKLTGEILRVSHGK